MGVLDNMAEARFWDNWESKFTLNNRSYVTPESHSVKQVVSDLSIDTNQSPYEIAKQVSSFIRNNHEYNLTKRWRTPRQTINEGKGDCEDYTFLLASILPHYGVVKYDIVTGVAATPAGEEFHVWLEIDGKVIDPTANANQVPSIDYMEELRFHVDMEDEEWLSS